MAEHTADATGHPTSTGTDNSSDPAAQVFRRRRPVPFLIGVAGGTASGKTTVCSLIMNRLQDQAITLIHQDSFYKGLTPEQRANVANYNFDHPDAFDHDALMQCIHDIKEGRQVEVPIYDFTTHSRSSQTRQVEPADVVIIEGILVLHNQDLRDALNMKVFVDTDDDVRLARRIQRDVKERGRDAAGVIQQYITFVKPAFDHYVAPSRRFADVIIPWQRGDNLVAIDLITEHIRSKLQQSPLRRIYPNLEVIQSNYQIRGMHTIIRDRTTNKNDFVFYADRLNRLVVEAGLGLLPFREKLVTTPVGHQYVGVDFARKLCGVSIIRSGESMEAALRTCCKGIKIGKILVVRHKGLPCNPPHSNSNSNVGHTPAAGASSSNSSTLPPPPAAAAAGRQSSSNGGSAAAGGTTTTSSSSGGAPRPRWSEANGGESTPSRGDVIYEKLPADIAERYVLVMDPVLSTGGSATRAIEVLLARGVPEDKILFLCIIAAPEGISRLCSRFPAIKLITSEIDDHVDDRFAVVPGCGEFGDRYFCD